MQNMQRGGGGGGGGGGDIRSEDVRAFARTFAEVSAQLPETLYPVLLRELVLQRCCIAARRAKATVPAAQAVVRELAIAILAFQCPLLGTLNGTHLGKVLEPSVKAKVLHELAGQPLEDTPIFVFEWQAALGTPDDDDDDDDNPHAPSGGGGGGGVSVDWAYLDHVDAATVMRLANSEASQVVSTVLALVLGDFGQRAQTIVTLVTGERHGTKRRILTSPPTIVFQDEARGWFYNDASHVHQWVEVQTPSMTVGIDGACFDYESRATIMAWDANADAAAHGPRRQYAASERVVCTRDKAHELLDTLATIFSHFAFDLMSQWDL